MQKKINENDLTKVSDFATLSFNDTVTITYPSYYTT